MLRRAHATVRFIHHWRNAYFVNILIDDELPNSSEINLNLNPLAKVNIEEYYFAVNSNLNIGSLCTPLATHGCVFDLFLLPSALRNHARYIPNSRVV
eukprot:6199190-Pleurochrysis_carterae.AAC.3